MGSEKPSVTGQGTEEEQCLLFGDFNEDDYGRYFDSDVAVKFVNDVTSKKEIVTNEAVIKVAVVKKAETVSTSWADLVEDSFDENQFDHNSALFDDEPIFEEEPKSAQVRSSATAKIVDLPKEAPNVTVTSTSAIKLSHVDQVKEVSNAPALSSATPKVDKADLSKPVSVEAVEEEMQQLSVKEKVSVAVEEKKQAPKPKPSTWAALFKSNSTGQSPKPSNIISVQVEQDVKNEKLMSSAESLEASKVISVQNDVKAKALADFLQKSSLHLESTPIQLRGLINNGNWCYINATLQSLLGCSAFYYLFKSMLPFKHKLGAASSTPLTDTMIAFVNEFSTLEQKAKTIKGSKNDEMKLGPSFEPKQVYEILSVLKTTLSETGKQQDAEEFLTFLLNGLHEEFLSLSTLVQNTTSTKKPSEKLMNGNIYDKSVVIIDSEDCKDSGSEVDTSKDDWEQVGRNNKSANLRQASDKETLITNLFGGIIRSSVHHAGAKESASLQPFFTIQLDIQAENICNIKDAFENYFTKENLEGFTSSKTNSMVEASHKTSLEKLPRILILHLKYFIYDKTGGCQKSHKAIEIERALEIPTDVLSSSLKGRVPANQRTYELFAIEFHHGKNAAGGHYTTAVKHKDPLGWVYCNDNIIQKTHFTQIVKHHKEKVPYLLFYERSKGN